MNINSNVLVIGGSRNVGYFSAVRLLDKGANVTFLLRYPSNFDNDEVIQRYVKSEKAHLVKGDAMIQSDVQHAWDEAAKFGAVDLLLFTVGATSTKFSLKKGMITLPENLVTQAILNVLCTLPNPHPKMIVITSKGITKASHDAVPLPIKPLYGWILSEPHKDKFATERCIAYAAGWKWDDVDKEPKEDLTGHEWRERSGMPSPGTLKSVVVLRPALFTDGECLADKKGAKAYRVTDTDVQNLKGGYTISRKDVAHFVVEGVATNWSEYEHKRLDIAY